MNSPVISTSHLRTDNFGGSIPKPVYSDFLPYTKFPTLYQIQNPNSAKTTTKAMKLNI